MMTKSNSRFAISEGGITSRDLKGWAIFVSSLSEKHITSLQVDLDDNGNIVRVHLKGSSGVKELDDAAIESFNNAGPFPNPPKGMVRNGKASIEWGFAVSNS